MGYLKGIFFDLTNSAFDKFVLTISILDKCFLDNFHRAILNIMPNADEKFQLSYAFFSKFR